MKAGLLICDHILPELEHIDGQYIDMFSRLFPEIEFIPYYACDDQLPEGSGKEEIYFCTGSRFSVYDPDPWVKKLEHFTRRIYQADKMLVGLCFGHQMMAHALGGKVEKASNGWCVGVHQFDLIDHKEWLNPYQENFNLLMMCQDQVIELPPASKVLARSANCPVAMFTIGAQFLGIQAHPEFSKAYNQALFTGRTDKIGKEIVAKATGQMHLPLHTPQIVGWIMNFIRLSRS